MNWLFIFVFALQIVPLQMALVPLLQIFSTWVRPMQAWLHDVIPIIPEQGYLPVWIAHTMFALPLAIFLLHNFISEIPGDVIEAAGSTARPRPDLRPDRPAARHAGARVVRDLPVHLGLERPARRPDLLGRHLGRGAATRSGSRSWSAPEARTGTADRCRVRLDRHPVDRVLRLQRYFVRGLLAGATKG